MNEAERKEFDEHEVSGLLPALRLRVQSFCAPLWWEVGGQAILANGTMCVIATPVALFGVTNDHVLKIYEKHRAENGDVLCQLGSSPFEPTENLISRSEYWDLATLRIPNLTLQHWAHNVFTPGAWPPGPVKKGDAVMLGGYPENRRVAAPGPQAPTMSVDFVSFLARAENWSDEHASLCFDSSSWYWPQGVELERFPDLSGASAGPCFRLIPEENRLELAGFIYEAHLNYEVIRIRQASLIHSDGTIVPTPPNREGPSAGA